MRKTLIFLIVLLVHSAYSQSSKRFIDSLKTRINTLTNPKEIVNEKVNLLLKYYTTGNQNKAKVLLADLQKEQVEKKSDYGIAAVNNAKGILFYYESDFDSSLYYLEKALELRRKVNDSIGIVKTISNIGGIHFLRYEYKKALQYYEEGLKLESQFGYEEGEYISLNNLGTIHNSLKIYEKALVYLRKAEKRHLKNNTLDDLIYTYDNFSEVYKDMKQLDSALYYALKSKDLSIQLNEQHSLSYAYVTVATALIDLKRYDSARANLQLALALTRKLSDERLMLAAYGNLAIVEMELNHMDSAFTYLEKVMALQKKLNVTASLEDEPKLFAEYYYRKKDYKNAYEYLAKYLHSTDSIYQQDIALQLNDMRTKYETEKKEKQNQLLESENRSVRMMRNLLLAILAIAIVGVIGAMFAYKKIKTSKELIGVQKQLVEEKQKEILDSINYAKRIQFALLASDNLLKTHLKDYFVLFKPKDVVSGDFYWGSPTSEGFIYITADCTGHGVPGAFMSLLNISKLSQVINEKTITRPNEILNEVRSEIIKALNPYGNEHESSKDGMDAVLCKLNLKKMTLEFAAANNSFYIIRDKKILHCKADKMPVGKGHDDNTPFTHNEIALQKGDVIYTFTDGFADQFGGAMGKKFKYKNMEELIFSVHHEPMEVQKQKLSEAFEKWKGPLEQVDDVCVIGVKIA